jgi:hypothetical protein
MIRNAWIRRGTMGSAIATVAALSGCADDPAVDPTGNWVQTFTATGSKS